MRFVSKFKELIYVVKPGGKMLLNDELVTIPAQYVEFHDFQAETADQKAIDKMLADPGFGSDFWQAAEETRSAQELKDAKICIQEGCNFVAKTMDEAEVHARWHAKRKMLKVQSPSPDNKKPVAEGAQA